MVHINVLILHSYPRVIFIEDKLKKSSFSLHNILSKNGYTYVCICLIELCF